MISLLLPTRKRPDNLRRMYQSALDTAKDPSNIEVIVAIDDDDDSYQAFFDTPMPNMKIFKKKRQVLSKYWNDCYELSKGDIVMHCGDDIIFRTQNWDLTVLETFAKYPDNILFVFGDDGSPHNGTFGTHGFIHRTWAETVGHFVPPYFSSDFNDTWLNDVAKALGRHYHIDILTEHMHPDFGKAELDITHRERIARHQRDNVYQLYLDKGPERDQDVAKLKEKMQ